MQGISFFGIGIELRSRLCNLDCYAQAKMVLIAKAGLGLLYRSKPTPIKHTYIYKNTPLSNFQKADKFDNFQTKLPKN